MRQKENQKKIFFPKGSVAVFALVLMFILAVATIGIITTAAIERKVSISTGNSTTAFQIAESGMEITLQYFKSNFDKKLSDIPLSSCANGVVTYSSNNTIRFKNNDLVPAYITDCDELISKVKIIKSIGTTKQETRAIEEDVFLGATKLLLHFDGINDADEFEDSSFYYAKNSPIDSHEDVTASTDKERFGGGSAYFDGDGDYLSVPDSNDWDFGSGDFTIDWWEYRTDGADFRSSLQRQSTATGYNPFLAGYKKADNKLYFYASNDGTSWNIASDKSMGDVSLNQWVHLAIVRKGNNFYTFKNGQQQATWSSSAAFQNVSAPMEIGRYKDSRYFKGYIDEFRISKGIARWTSNFTPPTTEYWPD